MATDLSRLQSVAIRLVHDPEFAKRMKAMALEAIRKGPGTPEFEAYFEEFAATPGGLAGMGLGEEGACLCESTTWTTLSTVMTPVVTCCAATTTTTTSGSGG
jgi:hypothetical protein